METLKGANSFGTTRRGIGPTYASKCFRLGLRLGDLHDWPVFVEKYSKFVSEMEYIFRIEKFDKQKELD